MLLKVLALDYDGTIARDDVLDADVRAAIPEMRARGVVVLIVTGRRLTDLQRVAGDLSLVDGVVAENGAVVAVPDAGISRVLGPSPPVEFISEVRRAGVVVDQGDCVVEADAAAAPTVLQVIRRLELPLTLAFNRSRMMVLPAGISKSTGLRAALTALRVSPRNAIAVGDAENDHDLLHLCEIGVAVSWGSRALKAIADYVVEGSGAGAVAPYLRSLLAADRIVFPTTTRRRLRLGATADGTPVDVVVKGRNVLIAGEPRSGKSWITGLLCEQLILHGYCVCVLDPEGDYAALEPLPNVRVLGRDDPLPRPRDLLTILRYPDVSVVIDLSHKARDEKIQYVRSVLPMLATLRRAVGVPHRIVLDEAHYFLSRDDAERLLDLQVQGYTLVSYRVSDLPAEVLTTGELVIVTRETDPEEIRALERFCLAGSTSLGSALANLELNEGVLLPVTQEAGGRLVRFRFAPRMTPHVRHRVKYLDLPVSDAQSFIFTKGGTPVGARARTLKELVAHLTDAAPPSLEGHLRRGDLSRWIADVYGDNTLAKQLAQVEDRFRHKKGNGLEAAEAVVALVRNRYEA